MTSLGDSLGDRATAPLVVGDAVLITSASHQMTATVSAVSEDSWTIAVVFDGLFRLANGVFVGKTLPLLFVGGRQWIDVLGDTVVELDRMTRH